MQVWGGGIGRGYHCNALSFYTYFLILALIRQPRALGQYGEVNERGLQGRDTEPYLDTSMAFLLNPAEAFNLKTN